MTASKLIS